MRLAACINYKSGLKFAENCDYFQLWRMCDAICGKIYLFAEIKNKQ